MSSLKDGVRRAAASINEVTMLFLGDGDGFGEASGACCTDKGDGASIIARKI